MKRTAAALVALALTLAGCTSSGNNGPKTATGPAGTTVVTSSAVTDTPTATPSPTPSPSPTSSIVPSDPKTWPVPLAQYTPGSVKAGCTYPAPPERNVSSLVRAKVAAEYHITVTGLANLEYDHLVPHSICGDDSAANIWPELYDGVPTSAYVHNRKDQLEAFAASQVRNHRWTLGYAQTLFMTVPWPQLWCKYTPRAGVTC